MKANQVKRIVIHCSAGFSSVAAIKRYWFNVLKWKTGGYHIIIDLKGFEHQLYPFDKVVNGAMGFNLESLHISYVGGVQRDNYKIAEDTRTELQKIRIEAAICKALDWIDANGGDSKAIDILGHRDLSPDQNGNGIIETWERTKECPSYDAIPEYKHLTR